MANYLLSMQFDRSGCTDKTVINLGGVSFNHTTSLGQAAYFQPYDVQSGFKIVNSHIKQVIENGNWCIYFKYKINKDDLIDNTPLIIFYKNNEYYEFLTIEKAKAFVLHLTGIPYRLTDIEYTFDNEWHTFYASFENGIIRFFVDGYFYNQYGATKNKPDFGETFYIGTNTINANFCGYLNDFNIFEGVIYHHNFVPPSNYICQADIMTNYKDYVYTTPDDFEPDLIDSIERNREHSASRLLEHQKGSSPRFLKLTWYQITDEYFKKTEDKFNIPNDLLKGIYINITGIDTTLLTNDDRYFSCNLETALELKKVHPLMVFVNKRFIRLSRIKLIRSNEWYTLFINDIDPKTIVESLDIILLPFNVIYEEDYGEREDLNPLYKFNKEGQFVTTDATTYYYIDSKASPYIKQIGIREYEGLIKPNYAKLNFIWRYGKLETKYVSENYGAFMQFYSDTEDHFTPENKVIIYTGTTLLDPTFYRVVGHDLIYFENIADAALISDRTVTLQIITDDLDPLNNERMIKQDNLDVKTVDVEATEDYQMKFALPEVVDGYGNGYRTFLIFKGHVLLEEYERYIIDYDKNELKLLHYKDALPKGRSLTFIFVKIDKMGANGRLAIKPLMYYCHPMKTDLKRIEIPIENTKYTPVDMQIYTLKATEEKQTVFTLPKLDKYTTFLIFKNGLLFPNSEYSVNNRTLTLEEDRYILKGKTLYIVALKNTNVQYKRYLNFLQRTILSHGKNTVIPPEWYDYEENMLVFLGGRYLDPSVYQIKNHMIFLEEDDIDDSTKTFTFVMIVSSIFPPTDARSAEYNNVCHNFGFHYSQSLEPEEDTNGIINFSPKFKEYDISKKNFLLFANGIWIHPDRYKLNSNTEIEFLDESDKHHASYTHYNMIIPNIRDEANIEVLKNNSMVFFNSTFISPYRYKIIDNTIIMHDDFKFPENARILVVLLTLTTELNEGITARSKIIRPELTKGRRYILYDLGISKKIKIGLNNLVCFDQNGLLIRNFELRGEIYNFNIIKYLETNMPLEIQPTYLTCVYNEDTLDNTANINRFANENFLREYIQGKEEFYEMDINFDKLLADFNFDHDQDLTYGENLSNSLDYIVSYNQNKIDDVYEKNATAFIRDFDINKFITNLNHVGDRYTISIERDEYETNKKRTFPLYFINGRIADWITTENNNQITLSLPYNLANTSRIQSINFRGLNNFLYSLESQLGLDKKVIKDIPMKITTGRPFIQDIFPNYARIEVIENANIDIPSTITVDIAEPQMTRIKLKEDLLDCIITVSNVINQDLICRIIVPVEIYGVPIDYLDYANAGVYYDIFVRTEVVWSDSGL